MTFLKKKKAFFARALLNFGILSRKKNNFGVILHSKMSKNRILNFFKRFQRGKVRDTQNQGGFFHPQMTQNWSKFGFFKAPRHPDIAKKIQSPRSARALKTHIPHEERNAIPIENRRKRRVEEPVSHQSCSPISVFWCVVILSKKGITGGKIHQLKVPCRKSWHYYTQ